MFLSLSCNNFFILFGIPYCPSRISNNFWSISYSLFTLSSLSSRCLIVFSCSFIWFFSSLCLMCPLRESSILSFWSWISSQIVWWMFSIWASSLIFSSRYFFSSWSTTLLFWFFYFSRAFCFEEKAFLFSRSSLMCFMFYFS